MSRTCIVAALALLLAACGDMPPPRSDGSPCATYGEASQQCQAHRYASAGG
ncbi:hypothetical protein JJB11_11560 [Ramlibacter ginsenosidimutans]|uniref:Lipoprotein n=1 Tax=Ramlibacter ginsenosidimutans TaxID=502333 RepID=A0A934TTY3_9BURK|nr:hypothetical protein [Ramlibacter ginsenosidimutans]MBK6006727.1 hypothetical protein [Ramlibacter ginsenosidimutans]